MTDLMLRGGGGALGAGVAALSAQGWRSGCARGGGALVCEDGGALCVGLAELLRSWDTIGGVEGGDGCGQRFDHD